MEKRIDLTQTVYQLTQEYPEIIDIMALLGFTEIKKKAIRHSAGKLITIPKGAAMKGISLDQVVKALRDGGFSVAIQVSWFPFQRFFQWSPSPQTGSCLCEAAASPAWDVASSTV